MDKLDFFRNIFLFSGLAEAEKDGLLKEGTIHSFPRKTTLFRQGDTAQYFFVICSGAVRLFHETPDGREVTSHIRIAGDTICITEIFSPTGLHHTHAVAVSDVTTLKFSAEWLKECAQQYSAVSSNLLSVLSQRAHRLEVEAENQTSMSAHQRVACFLKRTCEIYRFDLDGFYLPYRKSLIASRLGLTQETLSRTFPKLEEMGITIENKYVVFHDLPAMERAVCAYCSGAEPCEGDCDKKKCYMYKCGVQKTATQYSIVQ